MSTSVNFSSLSHGLGHEEDKDQSLNLVQRQLLVWSISDFIFLASAYEGQVGGQSSLAVSSSNRQCTVSVLIIPEFADE